MQTAFNSELCQTLNGMATSNGSILFLIVLDLIITGLLEIFIGKINHM